MTHTPAAGSGAARSVSNGNTEAAGGVAARASRGCRGGDRLGRVASRPCGRLATRDPTALRSSLAPGYPGARGPSGGLCSLHHRLPSSGRRGCSCSAWARARGWRRSGSSRRHAMGNCCWTQCFGLLRREAGRLQRAGGGSKYFRTCPRGEHLTIEFENLVESDEGESPGSSHRPLTEEEIVDLQERHYDSIAEKQKDVDRKIQRELALQEEKLRLEEEALYAAQREAARAARQRKLLEQEKQRIAQRYHPSSGDCQSVGPEDDFEASLRNIKSQYEVFRSSRLSSDATVLTPNTESSCDLMTKTKSTSGNDDSTSLDLEWEDEEGMNRMLPMRERSKTEEDILRAALKCSSKKGSNPTSASDDSNGLEWENDFVSAEMDDNGNSEYAGFVNPVLELSESAIKQSDTDQQIR
uniref:Adaptor-related protein complex 1 associated regulatory protein n=4 Tax=Rattus norvegicus TaxID=10116 RepID=F1M9P0_RAT